MSAVTELRPPRDPYARTKSTRSNFELFGWIFMRTSGVILAFLVLGHLTVNLMIGDGVHAMDFAFVAGRWANPMWQLWDLSMLWLAMIHGTNGVRTIINDYAEKAVTRLWLKVIVAVAFVAVVVLGTLVIFTFDPCPMSHGALLDGAPSFCTP